jgi:succinate-semialdehyde dehydrogenase/glutarate-semialdehyde dehydrogenase
MGCVCYPWSIPILRIRWRRALDVVRYGAVNFIAVASYRSRMPAMNSPSLAADQLISTDPASGEVIGRIEPTLPEQIPQIVADARAAQQEWAEVPLSLRCKRVRRLGDVVYRRRAELAGLISREVGKPIVESQFVDLLVTLESVRYLTGIARWDLRPERVPHSNPAVWAKSGWLFHEPYGVIGIVSPWNFPLAIPMAQIIPALLAGNAVVFKPSPLAASVGAAIGALCSEAGLLPKLVQVVQGGGEVGSALIDARPNKMIFTGSVETGRKVAEACARLLIPCVLELGGKDAMIVLADADLNVASSAAVWGAFHNCGQACLSVERVYAERSIGDDFGALCAEKVGRLRIGPGLDADIEMGLLIRQSQVERVEEQLSEAVARGAKILIGGKRRAELGPCFFEPTVITGVNHSMRLMREETFGPVLAIQEVANAAEAVRLANDSEFGLSASVWTRNASRGRAIAAQLHAGAVMVNDVGSYFGIAEAPHGGRGASGWGRTHSRLGLREMVQVKYVDVDGLPRWPKPWWFGYSAKLSAAMDGFIAWMYAPRWFERWRNVRRALGMVFRRGRV